MSWSTWTFRYSMPTGMPFGACDAVVAPMSLAIGWGLAVSTAVTLFLVPTLYTLASDLRGLRWADARPLATLRRLRPRGDRDGGGGNAGSGRNGTRDFHGERWSNETHASTTDGDALLYRKGKGKESRLCYLGHAMMENRNGLVVDGLVSRATGTAERAAAWCMASRRPERERAITLGADKAYDTKDFVADAGAIGVAVHAAQNTTNRRSAVPDEVAESEGYALSQTARKRIEEVFGWTKGSAGKARTLFRGLKRVDLSFGFHLCAYNLIRLPRLLAPLPP